MIAPFLKSVLVVGTLAGAATLVSANLNAPPTGHTGAPGEGTCADAGCHDTPVGGWNEVPIEQRSTVRADTVRFIVYLIHLTGPAPVVYGFQLSVVDSLDQPFGKLLVSDAVHTQLVTDLSGRQFLEHTPAGSTGGEFLWVRPEGSLPSDPIRIHASAVFADGDGTPAGDDVVTVTTDFPTCEITIPGDVNLSGRVTSADIIYLLNYVFKGGDMPAPCPANGDVNCDATITSGDVIHLVNFVFKNGTPPCDVCALVEHGVWDCY